MISIGLVSIVLILLIYTDPIWTRTPGGWWNVLIFLLIVALFFWLIIKLVKEVIALIKRIKEFTWTHLLPTILILLVFCFIFFNTISFDIEDRIYGKVIFQACYEGTQNQSTFKLRENNRFEIHATGIFFYDKYITGHYTQHGDTLDLAYDGDHYRNIGNKLLMNNKDQVVEPIMEKPDSSSRQLTFYYGYCQGLN